MYTSTCIEGGSTVHVHQAAMHCHALYAGRVENTVTNDSRIQFPAPYVRHAQLYKHGASREQGQGHALSVLISIGPGSQNFNFLLFVELSFSAVAHIGAIGGAKQ